MRRMDRAHLLPLAAVFALAVTAIACGGGAGVEPAPRGDALRIEEARAMPSPGGTGAVYLTVVNPLAEPDRLLTAATPAAKAAEVHETIDDGGMMRMAAFPDGLEIPPKSRVVLEPGGKHVMLLALTEPLVVGETIELELIFEKAGTVRVMVPVEGLTG